MEKVMEILNWIVASGPNMITAFVGALVALIAFFSLIPGDQPEKAMQSVVDFLAKFSVKKKE